MEFTVRYLCDFKINWQNVQVDKRNREHNIANDEDISFHLFHKNINGKILI